MSNLVGAAARWLPVIVLFACVVVGLIAASRWRSVTLRVPARLESIRPLTRLVERMGRKAALSEQAVFYCRLALDEACTNIIEHSYQGTANGEIEATIRFRKGACAISLTDFGKPYDPARVLTPERDAPLDVKRPGGLGLYLMRNVMDEVRYEPGPASNRLTMVKYNQPTPPPAPPRS